MSHPKDEAVRPSAERAISRPEKRKFLKELASQMRHAEVTSPAGVILGKRAIYPVELRRLTNVLQRTVRGLYRVCTDTVLPRNVTVNDTTRNDAKCRAERRSLGIAYGAVIGEHAGPCHR